MSGIRKESLLAKLATLEQGTMVLRWHFYSATAVWPWLLLAQLLGDEEGMQCPELDPPLLEIARGKTRCFLRKEGAELPDHYKASVLFVWLMSPRCRHSHLMYLSLLTTLPFMCCCLFLRFMRPNLQAMCVWIKGTWDSLFMSDPRKFPLSCLSEVHAESMMARWSRQSPGKTWKLLSLHFNWTENELTDS